MSRLRLIAPLAALLAALVLPALSSASYQDVIRDCSDDGKFSRHYTNTELQDAEQNLPNDLREYSGCLEMIRAELAKGGSGPTAGGGPGGGAGAGGSAGDGPRSGINGAVETASGAAGSPGDVAALAQETRRRGKPSILAAGKPITPTSGGLNRVASAANALPPELLVAILALIVLCSAAAATATWRRWPALVRAPIRFLRD